MPDSAVLLQSELHSYAPYGQIADPTALDTKIMGTGLASVSTKPWAYWPMATDPYDVSGNAHHGYNGRAPIYSQPAITSKCGLSTAFANGDSFFPTTQSKLGAAGGTYTYMGIVTFVEIPATGSAVGDRYRGSTFMSQAVESTTNFDFKLGFQDIVDGGCLILQSGSSVVGGVVGRAALNKPMVIAVVGTSLPSLVWTIDVWLNGVKVISGYPRWASTGGVAGWFTMGRLGNTERLANFRASNWAAWEGELSPAQIMGLTEAYMDKAAYSAAWTAR